jgi:molybdopterin/thiamine biosynthesis adenylyltransferase
MSEPFVLLPALYAERIDASGKNSGTLDLKFDAAEQVAVVDGFRGGRDGGRRQGLSDVPPKHYLAFATTQPGMGLWFRVKPELHLLGVEATRRDSGIGISTFRQHVVGGDWIQPGLHAYTLALTVSEPSNPGEPRFAAWRLQPDKDMAIRVQTEVVEERIDLLEPLRDSWHVDELAHKTVALIGAGSIGSAAAEALASYGIRQLALVDPDRLRSHNFARHRVHAANLGRYKVSALAKLLQERDSCVQVEAMPIDVIYDADRVRPMLREVDAVLVSSDGVDSRRAANHLARRAAKPAVFACVLGDGAFGEIMRICPPRTGCLLCARAELIASGGIDPEPALDLGYGTGSRHLPMTAVGGDLGLVAQLAAKIVVATLLDDLGYRDQRLPGDHAIVGLQPKPGMAPPFDIERAGEVRWRPLPPPRDDCPTCGRP